MHPPDDARIAKRTAAVQFLNNHLPTFGGSYRTDLGEGEPDYLADHLPEAVKAPFIEALASAARFLAADFAANQPAKED